MSTLNTAGNTASKNITPKNILPVKLNGSVLIFIAAVMWSFAGVGTKYVHWSALSVACVRGLLAAVTIGAFNRQWVFRPSRPVLLGAFCTFATSSLFMASNKITTAANAIVLQYTAPAFVIVISVIFLKAKFSKLDVMTVVFIFLGISLFFIDHIGHGAFIGDLLAILSGISFAGVFFANRLPGANAMQASYLGCLMSVFLLPFLIADPAVWAFHTVEWTAVVLMGIFQLGVSYMIFSIGIRTTSAFSASIICTIEPILNPIWVFLLIGERPNLLALAGACVVVATIAFYNIITIRKASDSNSGQDSA